MSRFVCPDCKTTETCEHRCSLDGYDDGCPVCTSIVRGGHGCTEHTLRRTIERAQRRRRD